MRKISIGIWINFESRWEIKD